ncbi:MAG: beta-CASP ribonuclease aCPSF1 [Euryarchaeota archaeon]|nr:beta-CASP ribonuclease aCPSF1 [Euryarchaeota archaeon]
MRLTFKDIKEKLLDMMPSGADYEIDLEAASIAIITKTPEEFNNSLIGEMAKTVKRRIIVRPHESILMDINEAKEIIKKEIPDEALVLDIWFDPAIGVCTIECKDPALGVGKRGVHLKKLRDQIGWHVKIIRASRMDSRTINDVRMFRAEHSEERKKALRRFGNNVYRPQRPGEKWVRLTGLGAYGEIGRACHLITTNESRVIIDVGAKPGREETSMPYFSAPEMLPPDKIDAVVITHAHLDHVGMLPVLYKYGYRGPVYCTPPTRDLMVMLQLDFIKVAQSEGRRPPYTLEDVQEMMLHVVDVDWNQTTDIAPDIKMTFFNAGHILGSSSVHMHIGDGLHNVVISGDIKFEKSWLFDAATVRFPRVETLVIESTYGGPKSFQPSRAEATQELQDMMKRVLARGGKVFCPVFAIGRSQELMLAIDQLFKSGECEPVPVWLDGMITEATAIHSMHPDYLNQELRQAVLKDDETNPFSSKWFRKVESRDQRETIINTPTPCIVLATSGMMSGGPIIEYFKNWAGDSLNTLAFVGYQAEGTLGRRLRDGFKDVPISDGGRGTDMVRVECDMVIVDGMSGHSDRRQLMDYVKQMNPRPRFVVVHHGDPKVSNQFRQALREAYRMRTVAPSNLETIRLA